MVFNCVECGAPTNRILVDMLNVEGGSKPICAACLPAGYDMQIAKDGTIEGTATIAIDPTEVINQINPDKACDFCDCPDPMWIYDLDVEPLGDIELGKTWTACGPCSEMVKSKNAIGTVVNAGRVGNVTLMLQIHQYVMDGLSNRRPYVRDAEDGISI